MDNKIKVAVWMVTYNHEKFIEKAILSVINQKTNFKFKLFIGEDHSSDNTNIICSKLKSKFPEKIELISNSKNLGNTLNASNIFKKCFNSNAEYIALLEGDDYWTDEYKLQKQVDFLDNNPDFVACYGGCFHVDENDTVILKSRFKKYGSPTKEKLILAQAAMITNSVMFRNVIKELPPIYFESPSGDTILYHLLGFHGKGKFLPELKFSAYRIHNQGIWSGIDNVTRIKNTFKTLTAIHNNLLNHFDKKHPYIKKLNYSAFKNVNGYLITSLRDKEFKTYFSLLKIIFNQKTFSSSYILKKHYIDLFKRLIKK
ncbi:MAG: glycosyltransferase [Vicingaceae bacterium]